MNNRRTSLHIIIAKQGACDTWMGSPEFDIQAKHHRYTLYQSYSLTADVDNSTRQCGSKLKVGVGNQDAILVDVVTNLTAKRYAQNITTKDQVSFWTPKLELL